MPKCKICQKACQQCEQLYCDSCIEDLSEDETRVAVVKRKAIIKDKKKTKGKMAQYRQDEKAQALLKKKINQVFFEDTYTMTQTDLSFYSYLLESKCLKLAEMNYLAGFRKSNRMNESSSRLLFDFNQREILEIYFFVENSLEIFLFFNAKSLPEIYHSDKLSLDQQPIIKTNTLISLGGAVKPESKYAKSYFILKNDVRKRCLTQVYNHKKSKMEVRSLHFAEEFAQSLVREDLQRILRAVNEKSSSESNGIVIRSLTIGKLLLSQHVEKVVISKEQFQVSFDTIIDKIRKKGISIEIEKPSHLESHLE